MPHLVGGIDRAGTCDTYDLTLDARMADLIGRLIIDWEPANERAGTLVTADVIGDARDGAM